MFLSSNVGALMIRIGFWEFFWGEGYSSINLILGPGGKTIRNSSDKA